MSCVTSKDLFLPPACSLLMVGDGSGPRTGVNFECKIIGNFSVIAYLTQSDIGCHFNSIEQTLPNTTVFEFVIELLFIISSKL